MNELLAAAVMLFPLLVILAAVHDLMTMTIPNAISLLLVSGFAAAAALSGLPLAALWPHLAVAAAVLALTFTLFALGHIGGGDAKLAAAISLWLGTGSSLQFLIAASFFGGLLSIAILSFRAWTLPAFALGQAWIVRLHAPRGGIPYGIALAAGALFVFPESRWFAFLAAL